jgi:hypothetical protein
MIASFFFLNPPMVMFPKCLPIEYAQDLLQRKRCLPSSHSVVFYEMHCWKFTQFESAGVVFCLVVIVTIFSNSTMIADVM